MTTLVYFAPVAWDSYLQRPHFMARHFLARGGRVCWVDPYPTRVPRPADLLRRPAAGACTPKPEGLRVVTPRALPIEPLRAGQRVNLALFGRRTLEALRDACGGTVDIVGIGRPSSLALAALDVLAPRQSFFDAMDDFPEFYTGVARAAVADVESRIVKRVTRAFAPSPALAAKMARTGAVCTLLPNACDAQAMPPVQAAPPASPVAGFVGCISTWFDWEAVFRLADSWPDVRIDLSGPCFAPPPAALPPSITLRPACAHDEALARMRGFSLGLIPFVRNTLTDGVDPIKFYEYRALGLPVLTTRFGSMAGRVGAPGVHAMDDEQAVRRAMTEAGGPRDADAAGRFRQAHDWGARFDEAELFAR